MERLSQRSPRPILAMNPILVTGIAILAASAGLRAQSPAFLFNTSSTETTLSGSGGTVLQTLRPNEVAHVSFSPCPVISAEKWAPRTCYDTMAGDADLNGTYSNPALFGSIDALCDFPNPVLGCPNPRSVYFSPSQPLNTNVSGTPGLRPGDTGRIVRMGTLDGQVEYFLRAEDLQSALGMPTSPILVDVDAIAADPGYGIFVSLDGSHAVNTVCGLTSVQDGDVLLIPASAITWTWDLRVQSVLPGQAVMVYTEAQMDAMVANAGIFDRFGNCVTQVIDVEALDIDYSGPVNAQVPCTGIVHFVPTLIFSAETLTGAGLCSTDLNGTIYVGGCGRIGNACGTPIPTLGTQMGLQPPSGTLGVASWVNALTGTWAMRYVIEPQQHVVNSPSTVSMDVWSPSAAAVVFVTIAPPVVAPSFTLWNCTFPDVYVVPPIWWTPVPAGFSSFTSPTVIAPIKLVWQGAAIVNGNLELSTPATVDVN